MDVVRDAQQVGRLHPSEDSQDLCPMARRCGTCTYRLESGIAIANHEQGLAPIFVRVDGHAVVHLEVLGAHVVRHVRNA